MSWLKIDDGFEDHPKVEPISDAAHRLWTRAACWCQKTGSDGFVPRAMLLAISKNAAPLKRLERLAQELVDARAGGVFESGLWESVDGGWRFHDWDEYQPESKPPEDKPEPMSRSNAARAAGIRSAQVRRERNGTAQPALGVRSVRTSPERPPNDVRTFEARSNELRSEAFDRTNFERPRTSFEPPVPDPGSNLPEISLSKDLLGSAREEPEEQSAPAAQCERSKPKHVVRFESSFENPKPAALELFDAYRTESGKTGACFDHRARELFERLVDEGETVASVRLAVAGAKLESWARDDKKLAASVILSSAEQREKYRAIALDPPRTKGARTPPQPNDESNRYDPRKEGITVI